MVRNGQPAEGARAQAAVFFDGAVGGRRGARSLRRQQKIPRAAPRPPACAAVAGRELGGVVL